MDPSERVDRFGLSNLLPFLTKGLCQICTQTLTNNINSLQQESKVNGDAARALDGMASLSLNGTAVEKYDGDHNNCKMNYSGSLQGSKNIIDNEDNYSLRLGSLKDDTSNPVDMSPITSSKMLRVDMYQEDDLEAELECERNKGKGNGSFEGRSDMKEDETLKEHKELERFRNIGRKKDFSRFERVDGKMVNILEGLELHTGVFNAAEQKRIVSFVEELQEMGANGKLRARTFTAPQKWMKGKGRVTLQFGCCYNYATDKKGNPPGILKDEFVDPLPLLFKLMMKRLVRWHILPPTCVPDSCIVNIYDEGDCIPPHIDNHEFVRPFCTISFLSECNIVFGTRLKVIDAGVFSGAIAIPLPVGSVLVLKGNGADVAKHCVPSVPTKRISITFRRMDKSKRPIGFVPEPDLQGLQPLPYGSPEPKKIMQSNPGRFLRERSAPREDNGSRVRWSDRRSSEPRNFGSTRGGTMNWRNVI